MLFNDLASLATSMRIIFGSVTFSFGLIAILRLLQQYRKFHYSQSIYLIALVGSLMGDAVIRVGVIVLLPQSIHSDLPASIAFATSQLLEAAGMMTFVLYLTGITNGFWSLPGTQHDDLTLPGR